MDGLKTLRPTGSATSPVFEMKKTRQDSTGAQQRPNSSGKLLQLTPLWEHVIKYQRLPPDLDLEALFTELASRLHDLEWEVTQHAVRFLVDLIPVVGDVLDSYMIPNVLTDLINNLGHSAPAVRKGALDALRTYLRYSIDPEAVLSAIITDGLEAHPGTKNLQSNVAIGVILSAPSLIFPLINSPSGSVVSQDVLVQLVSALSKKLVQVIYQEAALKALVNIRDMVGEAKFDRFLEGFHAECKKDFDLLCQVYDVRSKQNLADSGVDLQLISSQETFNGNNSLGHDYRNWSDDSPPQHDSSGPPSDNSFTEQNRDANARDLKEEKPATSRAFVRRQEDSLEIRDVNPDSDEGTQGENSESAEGSDLDDVEEGSREDGKDFLQIVDDLKDKSIDEDDEDVLEPNRVILETEIKFNEQTAITMTILEEEKYTTSNGKNEAKDEKAPPEFMGNNTVFNNNFVMKVLTDEDYDYDLPVTRTPRRVRFGGEMVMMRTPDSDILSDYCDEAKITDDSSSLSLEISAEGGDDVVCDSSPPNNGTTFENALGSFQEPIALLPLRSLNSISSLPSQIPLPINPALNKPKESWKKGPVFTKSNFENSARENSITAEDVKSDNKRLERSGSESPIPNLDGGESLASSSDGEQLYKIIDGRGLSQTNEVDMSVLPARSESDNWEDLNIVDQGTMKDIHDKDDWRARLRGLETLRCALQDPRVLELVGPSLPSLLRLLLSPLLTDSSHRVDTAALAIVRELIAALPVALIRGNLQQLVVGLCRHIANTGSISVNIEAVQAARILMQTVNPTPVIDILITRKCLGAKSSKMRENALLFIIYTTMTFPSTEFACQRVATCVLLAGGTDARRRVRLASLETLAVLGQLTGTKWLLDTAVEILVPPRAGFLAAVKSRLARRQLPTIAQDTGLLLYALQLPANTHASARARKHEGADVEWILDGTGSVSSGSARSRNQLVGQRKSPPTSVFVNMDLGDISNHSITKARNPWIDRRPTDMQAVGVAMRRTTQTSGWVKTANKNSMDNQRSWEPWTEESVDSRQGRDTSALVRRVPSKASSGRLRMPPLAATTPTSKYELERESQQLPYASGREEGRVHQATLNMPSLTALSTAHNALDHIRDDSRGLHEYSASEDLDASRQATYRRRSVAPNRLQSQDTFDPTPLKRTSFHQQPTSPVKRSATNIISTQLAMPPAKNTIPQKPLLARYDNALPRLVAGGSRSEPVLFPIPPDYSFRPSVSTAPVPPPSTEASISNPTPAPVTSVSVSQPQPLFVSTFPSKAAFPALPVAKPTVTSTRSAVTTNLTLKPEVTTPQVYNPDLTTIATTETTVATTQPLPPSAIPAAAPELSSTNTSKAMTPGSGVRPVIVKPVAPKASTTTSAHIRHRTVITKPVSNAQNQATGMVQNLESNTLSEDSKDAVKTTANFPADILETKESDQTEHNVSQTKLPTPQSPKSSEESTSSEEICKKDSVTSPTESDKKSAETTASDSVDCNTSTSKTLQKRTSTISNNSMSKIRGIESSRASGRVQQRIQLYPDTLKPTENPKDALQQFFDQMDHTEWEMTMQGLTTLVRLTRHHSSVLHGAQLHAVVVCLVKQVRNLRSQIARAACQVSGELFAAFKRALDPDLEELVGALLHRSADTNKFLRADSNAALDVMLEHCSPAKIVQTIVFKGASGGSVQGYFSVRSHKNATVRSVAARLLVNLTAKLGPEKVLASPRDMRDKILLTGANLLTEGSLETRSYAKELFRSLSSQPSFNTALSEAVPAHTLRNIKKTLLTLK